MASYLDISDRERRHVDSFESAARLSLKFKARATETKVGNQQMSQLFQEIKQAFDGRLEAQSITFYPLHGSCTITTNKESYQVELSKNASMEIQRIAEENGRAYVTIKPADSGFAVFNYFSKNPLGHLTADGFQSLAAAAA